MRQTPEKNYWDGISEGLCERESQREGDCCTGSTEEFGGPGQSQEGILGRDVSAEIYRHPGQAAHLAVCGLPLPAGGPIRRRIGMDRWLWSGGSQQSELRERPERVDEQTRTGLKEGRKNLFL